MAKEFDNTNRGALFFRNKDKKGRGPTKGYNPAHSDYNGTINVDGQEYWLNGWIKTSSKDGSKFMSMSVKAKTPKIADTVREIDGVGKKRDDWDQDIPF